MNKILKNLKLNEYLHKNASYYWARKRCLRKYICIKHSDVKLPCSVENEEKARGEAIKKHQFRFRPTISRIEPSIKLSPRYNNVLEYLPQHEEGAIISDFRLPGLGRIKIPFKILWLSSMWVGSNILIGEMALLSYLQLQVEHT